MVDTPQYRTRFGLQVDLVGKGALGHIDLKTTMRYTHVSNRTLENIKSPFDNLNLKKD